MSAPALATPGSVQRNVQTKNPSEEDMANLAYDLWQQRGAVEGSPEDDWLTAERMLREGVSPTQKK